MCPGSGCLPKPVQTSPEHGCLRAPGYPGRAGTRIHQRQLNLPHAVLRAVLGSPGSSASPSRALFVEGWEPRARLCRGCASREFHAAGINTAEPDVRCGLVSRNCPGGGNSPGRAELCPAAALLLRAALCSLRQLRQMFPRESRAAPLLLEARPLQGQISPSLEIPSGEL